MPTAKSLAKILIIRLSSIGDILLTTPVIRALKSTFPTCRIDFVIKKKFSELLVNHPLVNNLYCYDKVDRDYSLVTIKNKIKQQYYDLIIDLHKNWRSYYLTFASRAKQIVRYRKFAFRRLLLVKFKINFFRDAIPIYQRYLLALTSLGLNYDGKGFDIYFDEAIDRKITNQYQFFLHQNDKKIIGIAPGASFATKRWTIEGFQAVIDYFCHQAKNKIILFGDAIDKVLIESLNIKNNPNILDVAGALSILESAKLMDHCRLILANDSGLLHVASALKKPVVAIFGSTTEELGFFPLTTQHIVVQNYNVKCRPCSHIGKRTCPKGHFKCMKEITPPQVIAAVEKMM